MTSHLWILRVYCYFLFVCFWRQVSLYIPNSPGTHSVDKAGLKLRKLPASACQVLGLKACANTVAWYSPKPINLAVLLAKACLCVSGPVALIKQYDCLTLSLLIWMAVWQPARGVTSFFAGGVLGWGLSIPPGSRHRN